MVDTGILLHHMNRPSRESKGHSEVRPITVTFKPIIIYTNCMTLISSTTFTELREVSMDHLRRVWHAIRECLPFPIPGSIPFWEFHTSMHQLRPFFPKPAAIFWTFSLRISTTTFLIINTDLLRVNRSVRPNFYLFYSQNCVHLV